VLLGWRYFCACILIYVVLIGERGNRDRIKFPSFIKFYAINKNDDYSRSQPYLYYSSNSNSVTTDSVITNTN